MIVSLTGRIVPFQGETVRAKKGTFEKIAGFLLLPCATNTVFFYPITIFILHEQHKTYVTWRYILHKMRRALKCSFCWCKQYFFKHPEVAEQNTVTSFCSERAASLVQTVVSALKEQCNTSHHKGVCIDLHLRMELLMLPGRRRWGSLFV